MSPTPVAEGTLALTPFAHVVLSIQRRKLTGTLAIWPDDDRPGQDRVYFRNGTPVAGRLLDSAETLERGLLPIFRRLQAPYAFYEADLVGTAVGSLTTPCEPFALVAAALRGGGREDVVANILGEYQTSRVRIAPSFDAAAFRLVPKESAVIDLIRADPDTVTRLVERSGDEKTARRVLYLLAITRNLERHRPSSENAESLPGLEQAGRATFTPADPNELASAVSAAQSAQVTSAARPGAYEPSYPASSFSTPRPSVAPPIGPAPSAPQSSGSAPRPGGDKRRARGPSGPGAPPAPPAGLSRELTARWADLADRVTRADEQNYFEVLGLEDSAGSEQARNAYFDAVKKVHPDRLPPELATLRPYVERLFTQITEAKDTLENDEKRLKYVRMVKEGGGTPAADRKMMAVLSAAHELEKATVLSNLGKWNEVLLALEEAKALDPTQPDIYALEAWCYFNLLGRDPNATVENVLMLTERVLVDAKDGYHERALYTRALALKKQNRLDDAAVIFKRIVERNPRNLDAAREVRLFDMRQREPGKPTDAGGAGSKDAGLLSKLFGGKK